MSLDQNIYILFTLRRAWNHWDASASYGHGLPLNVATELHNKPYDTQGEDSDVMGENSFETYGQVVMVDDRCNCPHPAKYASLKDNPVVDNYHIYTQEGLNEFSRVVKDLI